MSFGEKIKSFGMTNMLLENDLDAIERRFDVKLREASEVSATAKDIEETYFPQFEEALRNEAAYMAKNYELFYCLEKTIRTQIAEMLEDTHGEGWWNDTVIPQHIVGEVKKRIQREREAGITPRSLVILTRFSGHIEVIHLSPRTLTDSCIPSQSAGEFCCRSDQYTV